MPRREPPRASASYFGAKGYNNQNYQRSTAEINRVPDFYRQKRSGAAEFGIERLAPGCPVTHSMFGDGVIVSAKDMGGDILYEVDFVSCGKKKLMATFAKLTKR